MKAFIPFAALAFAATSAFAHDWDDNPDMRQSILNDHSSSFVGTGYSAAKLERGAGDTYGSILLDKGTHTPHTPGDSHAPEMGKGDAYGSVLHDIKK